MEVFRTLKRLKFDAEVKWKLAKQVTNENVPITIRRCLCALFPLQVFFPSKVSDFFRRANTVWSNERGNSNRHPRLHCSVHLCWQCRPNLLRGTLCPVGPAPALLPLQPESAVTDARSDRSRHLATAVTHSVTGAVCIGSNREAAGLPAFKDTLRYENTSVHFQATSSNKKCELSFSPLHALSLIHTHTHTLARGQAKLVSEGPLSFCISEVLPHFFQCCQCSCTES